MGVIDPSGLPGIGALRADDAEIQVQMFPAVNLTGATEDDFGNGAPSLAFGDSATVRSYGLAVIPDSWTTFDIVGLFGDKTGNAGDAVFRVRSQDIADSTTVSLVDRGATTVTALGIANQKQAVTLASGLAHTDGQQHIIRVEREGAAAGDDLTGNMHLVGRQVILRKAS